MSESPATVFRFAAEGVDLEFAGSEDFVEKQLQRFQAFLKSAVGGNEAVPAAASAVAAPAPASATAANGSKESVAEFYEKHPSAKDAGRSRTESSSLSISYKTFKASASAPATTSSGATSRRASPNPRTSTTRSAS